MGANKNPSIFSFWNSHCLHQSARSQLSEWSRDGQEQVLVTGCHTTSRIFFCCRKAKKILSQVHKTGRERRKPVFMQLHSFSSSPLSVECLRTRLIRCIIAVINLKSWYSLLIFMNFPSYISSDSSVRKDYFNIHSSSSASTWT